MSIDVRRWAPIALLASLAGCASLFDLRESQCATDGDCAANGATFAGTVCRANTCVPSGRAGGLPGVDSSGGSVAPDAGNALPSASGSGCTSNAQCVSDNLDEPYACLKKGDACVSLKSAECPNVFGNFKGENTVYMGAFLNMPATAPLSQMSALNVQLAVDEINGSVGGLPGGPLGKLRSLVLVACRNDTALIANGAKHLLDEVGARAVIAHLPSGDLKSFFVDRALPAGAFVINPGFADNSLTSLSSGGLFWHVIGDIRDVAPAYPALGTRAETYVRSDVPATETTRVAMVVSKRFAEQSIADTLTPQLRFNGKTVTENGADFFATSVPALADSPTADYAGVNQSLLAFAPHIIIAVAREEMVYKIIPTLEAGWPAGKKRPLYILSGALSGNTDLLSLIAADAAGNTSEAKRRRFVGIAPASADDLTLYNQFLVRFRTAYPRFQNAGGFENFYDATYLLAYAMYAAGSVPSLTGADIARGMQRIVAGPASVDIGPTFLADGFTALSAGGSIRLRGTMGPSDFDPGVGARRGTGSVYCVARAGSQLSFSYDVLRFSKTDKTLQGTFPCFTGF